MKDVKRLFKEFAPEQYDIHLDLDDKKLTFSGIVIIHGYKKSRPSSRITLHQKDLKIQSAKITRLDKTESSIEVDRINTHKKYDEVRLHTRQTLYPGKYKIEVKFSGKITDQMNGIYPSRYKEDGHKKIILATQFESHHAREAFVCIDEPEAKAVFNLKLTSNKFDHIISNTNIVEQEQIKNRTTTTFDSTPIMSTYLLAFVIGDLDYLETKTKSNIKVRTYAIPELTKNTKFALDVASNILDFYEEYFDIPYPLDKCDFIALPDFASGAMENWGCITFRDQALLVDEHTPKSVKQYVANVVAHELTHQWFGNLVTMQWWTDLWLNESFASWMSYLGVDHIFPEWKVWTQFINDEQMPAFKLDSLNNTHPIEVQIHHPDEIRTIFDLISYEKGASVILMLENYLGRDNFQKGIRLYLKENSFKNTLTADLWEAMHKATKIDVAKIMDKWVKQAGYPIVEVTNKKDQIMLSQTVFNFIKNENNKTVWPIPLLSSKEDHRIFDTNNLQIEDNFLVLNKDRKAFYRTIYSEDHLHKILSNKNELTNLDKLGLLSDSFSAACAGFYSTEKVIEIINEFANQNSMVVWESISSILANVRTVLGDDELRELSKPFISKLVSKQMLRLGWTEKKDEEYFDTLLRPTILSLSAIAEDKDTIDKLLKMFKERKSKKIPGDIRFLVYATVARNGGMKEYEELINIHQNSNSPEEKSSLVYAITRFKDKEIHHKILEYIKSEHVRIQDCAYWISGSFSNPEHFKSTWNWLKENWKWLEETQGKDLSFYMMPNIVAANCSDIKFLPEFEDFFSKNMNTSFSRSIKQAIETITWQSAWKERDLDITKEVIKALS